MMITVGEPHRLRVVVGWIVLVENQSGVSLEILESNYRRFMTVGFIRNCGPLI